MIKASWHGEVLTLTLNRPDKANALTEPMLTQLADKIETAERAKLLILTGAGKVFSAGADLEAARAGLALSPEWERLSTAIAAFKGLSIAALNGTVAGGAMGMVLACDLRVSVPIAQFFYPVMKLGFLPQPSDPQRLNALVGPSRAKRILMVGEKIGSGEALSWGLVDYIDEAPVEKALDLGETVLSATQDHVLGIKSMISQ